MVLITGGGCASLFALATTLRHTRSVEACPLFLSPLGGPGDTGSGPPGQATTSESQRVLPAIGGDPFAPVILTGAE